MGLEDWNWSAPSVALIFGVGLGLLLVLTRGLWKTLPGWVKFLFFLAILIVFVMIALGRMPLPI